MLLRNTVRLLVVLFLTSPVFLMAQRATPSSPAPTPTPQAAPRLKSRPAPNTDDLQQQALELQDIMRKAEGEPGARLRGLQAFMAAHPHTPVAAEIYPIMIKDATALNDEALVLQYSETLQKLDPSSIKARIRVLNLLLLDNDAASIHQAQQYAAELRQVVEQKAKEPVPEEIGSARWNIDMNRLRALADLFLGAADQKAGNNFGAQKYLSESLVLAPTEEAAQHEAELYTKQQDVPKAVDAYALALALPGSTIAERARLIATAEALYKQLHGTDTGFGDLILQKFNDVVAPHDAAQRAEINPGEQRAHSAFDFTLKDLKGAPHQLKSDRGKVIVLDFWATWCGPCQIQHPYIEQLRQQYASNPNVVFIAVNTDADQNRVAPFVAAHHWTPDTWLDEGLADYWNVNSLPTTIVLNRKGNISFRLAGFDQGLYKAQLNAAIQQALQQAS